MIFMRKEKGCQEEKLSTNQMRVLWNILEEEVMSSKFSTFSNKIESDETFTLLVERGVIRCLTVTL
jgi:hypothetical protein